MALPYHANGHTTVGRTSNGAVPSLQGLSAPPCDEKEKAAAILRLLRQAALTSAKKKRTQFYSIREVARHFGVPATTIARIYGALKQEGVLTPIWGSKTFVESKKLDRNRRIKSILGLPASLRSFSTLANYRCFFLEMDKALWKAGFGARLIFYEDNDLDASNFIHSLTKFQLDGVVWLARDRNVLKYTRRLSDRGVRLITIVDDFPSKEATYFIDRRKALKKGLMMWKSKGITFVTVIKHPETELLGRHILVEEMLSAAGLRYNLIDVGSSAESFGGRTTFSRDGAATILITEGLASQLADTNPSLFRVIRANPMMVMDEGIDLPFGSAESEADHLEIDWRASSKRIVGDLISPDRLRGKAPVPLDAHVKKPTES
jgi:hypothetical protein